MSYATPWHWGYWPYWNPYCAGQWSWNMSSSTTRGPLWSSGSRIRSRRSGAAGSRRSAAELLSAARTAFAAGQYAAAQTQVDRAIAKTPADPALHEFRSLVLFAQQRYREAAAAIHSVLAARPGWDWATLSGLYPDVEVYTEQLRALEKYRRDNPDAAEARFLLAYHYLTIDQPEAAAKELQEALRINPRTRWRDNS